MVRKNSKISKEARLDWLLDRVCELEIERDEAIERAQAAELDNMRLRIKLNAVRDIVLREDFLGTNDDDSGDNGGTPAAENAGVAALDEQQIKTYKDEEREFDEFLEECERIRNEINYTSRLLGDNIEAELLNNELN